jgi:hypothetical protein
MSRVPRHIAMDLIQYAKKVHVTAYCWDVKSLSAVEFARQISSKKLAKQNPSFQAEFKFNEKDEPSTLVAEFSDGQVWTTETAGFTAAELRAEFFDRAAIAEEVAENAEDEKGKKK